MFTLAVSVLQSITASNFLRLLLDPTLSYQQAHEVLAHRLRPIAPHEALLHAIWVALRPLFAYVYATAYERKPVPKLWAHTFPAPRGLLTEATRRRATFEAFPTYLAVAGISEADAFRLELDHGLLENATANGRSKKSLCANGHPYVINAHSRTKLTCTHCGTGLKPGINDIATLASRVVNEWDCEANGGIGPEAVTAGSSRKYWWKCARGHHFDATPSNRHINKSNCPYCVNRRIGVGINDLATTHPDIAAELSRPDEALRLTASTDHIRGFTCPHGHDYSMRVFDRVNGKSCPECTRRTLARAGNSILETHPEIAAEWHPRMNKYPASHYSRGSRETVWWRCPTGHDFKQRIERRTAAGYRCGICSKRQHAVGVNDLGTTDPELVREWHSYRNWKTPQESTAIDKHFWWKCLAAGHEYSQTVDHRRKSRGCPKCAMTDRILVS